jgi:thiamine biosynthesis lipoprotein
MTLYRLGACGLLLSAASLCWPVSAAALSELTRTAYLMGTRVTLAARAADREAALATLEALLESLERSEARLSTWRLDTPLGRLNAAPVNEPVRLDPELCWLFRDLSAWRDDTGGAFDPAVGTLVKAWRIEQHPRLLPDRDIARLGPVARLASWRFDPGACTVARPRDGRLDSGGFGKGAALDEAARLDVAARGWLIDLGGQVGVSGEPPDEGWRVGVAHPARRDEELFAIRMSSGSLATSGGSERDRSADGRRISHIIDPRTGRPSDFSGSVVVWSAQGLAADILSTALYVMGSEEGLQWAESKGIAACYLVPRGDRIELRATRLWRGEPWERAEKAEGKVPNAERNP